MIRETYKIRGMSCNHCKEKIERSLRRKEGIKEVEVRLNKHRLILSYDPMKITLQEIKAIISELGYELVKEENISKEGDRNVLLLIVIAGGLFLILNQIVPDFSTLLTSGKQLGLVMLFVIGLSTSFHCVSMCGGIAVAQVVGEKNNLKRNMLYNSGRVISYTLLGGIVGYIGSGITLGNRFFSIVPIILGGIMIVVGLSNVGLVSLGTFKWGQKLNRKLATLRYKLSHDKGPFMLGLVNGLMPCGPLQLMQIYALGTGSFIEGALAMFAFSIGTVPLMLGLGVFINKLSMNAREFVLKLGGYLIVLLGASMMLNGLSSIGVSGGISLLNTREKMSNEIIMEDGYQVVRVEVGQRNYDDIVVQKDIPVKLIMNVAPGKLNGCNYAVNIAEYDIFGMLQEGENVFEFYPSEEGRFIYSCWMGMIRNTITVVDGDISEYVPEENTYRPITFDEGWSCH